MSIGVPAGEHPREASPYLELDRATWAALASETESPITASGGRSPSPARRASSSLLPEKPTAPSADATASRSGPDSTRTASPATRAATTRTSEAVGEEERESAGTVMLRP